MADCQGPCNNRARRDQAKFKDALARWDKAMAGRAEGDPGFPRPVPPDIRPWPGEPVFCGRCAATVHRELGELDDLAALRAAQLPTATSGGDDTGGRVSGTKSEPSPSPAGDDIDELAGWLRDWEAVIRGADPRPRRGYLASELTTIIAWLTMHFHAFIIREDIAADFGSEVRRWHAELTAKTAAGTGMRHQKKPCPRCRLYTLWLADGDDYVKCFNEDCQRRMTRTEYADLDKLVA